MNGVHTFLFKINIVDNFVCEAYAYWHFTLFFFPQKLSKEKQL